MGRRRHNILSEDLGDIVYLIYTARNPVTTKGDFAREYATEIATLAHMGIISTFDPVTQDYTNRWRLTPSGLDRITNHTLYA
ncbi:hypothetical protein UFOVP344_51 [uncultured Caudovirales phage]|uniref:Uncharacterized protein n=1 Tax=uncultured Caudovirales phage TaxID=2100421 RepID=A0A6J5M4H7_9CAUD|nr:hypothetical protein UFOVP344_51 [uncultured Caudovirales phage]